MAACALLVFALPEKAFAQQKKPPQPPAKKEQGPGPLETLLRQAQLALDKENYPEAAAALEEFLSYRPEDAIAHFQLGYAYTGLGRREDARGQYEKAIALDPKMAEAHLNLGLLLLEKDPEGAQEPLRKAAELMPGQAKPRFLLGTALERTGKKEAAVAAYQRARELDSGSFDIRSALARVLLSSARAAEAEKEFRRALELRGDAGPARLGLAESLVAQRRLEDAAKEFAAYLEAQPQDQESRLQLAGVYADLGKDKEALAELESAEAGGLRTPAVYRQRGELQARQKLYAQAAGSLEKALELEPQDAALRARLGRLRLELRDFPAAERELLAALRMKPELTEALRDLTAAYYLAENYAAALRGLELIEQREPLTAGSWFVRATCYDKLQRKTEAVEAYRRFVSLDQGRSERQDFQARQRIRVLTRELERKR